MLSWCATTMQDWQQALLKLRAIPIASDIPSPADLLHYRVPGQWMVKHQHNTLTGMISVLKFNADRTNKPVATTSATRHMIWVHYIYSKVYLSSTEMDTGNQQQSLK